MGRKEGKSQANISGAERYRRSEVEPELSENVDFLKIEKVTDLVKKLNDLVFRRVMVYVSMDENSDSLQTTVPSIAASDLLYELKDVMNTFAGYKIGKLDQEKNNYIQILLAQSHGTLWAKLNVRGNDNFRIKIIRHIVKLIDEASAETLVALSGGIPDRLPLFRYRRMF